MTKMFRNKIGTKMDLATFGIGSTITAGSTYTWLVIGMHEKSDCVTLVDLRTMVPSRNSIQVVDVNYLTEDEARKLVAIANPAWSFSDFSCHAAGFKLK